MKIKIEKHREKYIAYPVKLKGVVVGEGATREEAIIRVKSALRAYMQAPQGELRVSHPRHIVAVMGIVRDSEGRVLLIRSPHRGWEPPGGQVENGEDILTALKREVLEESGIVIEVDRLVAIYSNVTSEPTKLILTFRADVVDGDLQVSEESLDVGWFSPAEAIGKVTHPVQRQRLQDALLDSDGIIYRVYGTDPYRLLRTEVL